MSSLVLVREGGNMKDPLSTNRLIPSISASFDAFLLAKEAEGLSPKSVAWYETESIRILPELFSGTLADITPTIIREQLLALSTHRNPGGVHAVYRAAKAWLNWTWREFELDDILPNPIRKVRMPAPRIEPIVGISLKEVRKLLAVASRYPTRDKALLLCLLDTAARAAEFVSFDWADVDLLTGRVLIRRGKGGKARSTFIGARSRRALRAWKREQQPPDDEYPLWTSEREDRLTVSGLREIIRRKARAAGLKDVPSAHDFRRAGLKAIIANSADVITASRLAGHTDVRVTQRYDAQNEADLQRVFARASPVDNARL